MLKVQEFVASTTLSHRMKFTEIEPAYRQTGVVEIEVAESLFSVIS